MLRTQHSAQSPAGWEGERSLRQGFSCFIEGARGEATCLACAGRDAEEASALPPSPALIAWKEGNSPSS